MLIGVLTNFERLSPRPKEYSLTLSVKYKDLYPVLNDNSPLRRLNSSPVFK